MKTQTKSWMILTLWLIAVSSAYPREKKSFINENLSLHDVTLAATDVQKLAAFYSTLGLGRDPHVNNDEIVVFPLSNHDLTIHKSDKNSSIGVSFRVGDLDKLMAHLRKHDIEFTGPKLLRPGLEGIEIKDPNGNTISFLRPKK